MFLGDNDWFLLEVWDVFGKVFGGVLIKMVLVVVVCYVNIGFYDV